MSEKRKPDFILLLKKQGNKSNKIEIFNRNQFLKESQYMGKKFRIRLNGKWWPRGEVAYFNLTQIKEITFRTIGSKL
tara:strand:+ start:335 stop:565 length:231 start_codon:yes stop_codon:yes gene_type:complete